jgi:hypothetical protein
MESAPKVRIVKNGLTQLCIDARTSAISTVVARVLTVVRPADIDRKEESRLKIWFRVLVVFESVRGFLWAGFLLWFFANHDSGAWKGPEAVLPSITAAATLAFPYSWIAAALTGSWNWTGSSLQLPLAIAASNVLLWGAATCGLIWILRRKAGSGKWVKGQY